MPPLRLVFMGTPDLARTVLAALADDARHRVVAVIAQPDRPKGRDLQLLPPPVKVEALARGLPVLQPVKAREPAFLDQLRALARWLEAPSAANADAARAGLATLRAVLGPIFTPPVVESDEARRARIKAEVRASLDQIFRRR